ncbi:MAG: sugar phosphate isomerase/epimerase family protein [Verrucomicrobiales bacterium]
MKRQVIATLLALAGSLIMARATTPEFFAMDTGTRDAAHKTAEEQVALVKELGFAGLGPTYRGPEDLREVIAALDRHKLKMFALYVPLDIDSPEPIGPAIRNAIEQLRDRDAVIWLFVKSKAQPPSDPAGDAKAVPILREVADLAAQAGVRISLYPHFSDWLERFDHCVRLARQVERKNFGVTFNLCHWLKVEGNDLDARLREALPYLTIVTINGADEDGKDWKKLIQPLDTGTYDVGKVLAKLAELNWKGPIGLQHFGIGGDAKSNLGRSMKAWREMSGKVWPVEDAPQKQ